MIKTKISKNSAVRYFICTLFLLPFITVCHAATAPLVCEDISQLKIIGELEYVSVIPEALRQKARIDTGAQTSSMGIMDSVFFERDGKKWVRFHVKDKIQNSVVEFERPLKRIAKIKRHQAEATERPVVELKIKLGQIELLREFSLADRSQFKYPILIGRNVLNNKFLVNVGQKFSSSKIKEYEQ